MAAKWSVRFGRSTGVQMDPYEELNTVIVEAMDKKDAVVAAFENLGDRVDPRWNSITLLRSRS
jgi:hypothetical protein